MGARGPIRSRLKIVESAVEVADTVAGVVEPKAPERPDGLTGTLGDLWDELVPRLDAAGLVSDVDGLAIELALRHFVAARIASEELANADSVVVQDEKNDRQAKHPADAVFRLHSAAFLQYAGQLGMTFVSRARLPAKGADADTENPYAAAAAR